MHFFPKKIVSPDQLKQEIYQAVLREREIQGIEKYKLFYS